MRPMTEPTRAGATRSRSLAVLAVPLLIVGVLLAVAYGLGYLEIGLILVVLLALALPALTFYVWAKRRDDL